MNRYLTFSAVAGLTLCMTVASNIGPQLMASEISFFGRLFSEYKDVKLDQQGSIDYVVPVVSRRVSHDPRNAIVRMDHKSH